MNEKSITLSVSLITYNQKNFISQTIDSILQQKVDFNYEIIIGDDCSTDGTRETLLEYQKNYPSLIKLILHPQKNAGIPGKINFISTIDAAKGKYIALLDGDDYWTDPLKLQKQVDFLEANPDFAICFHRVKVVDEDGIKDSYLSNPEQKEVTSFEDLALGNYIHTPSCIFRNGLFGKFPDWFYETHVGDWVLHLLNAQYGKIRFLEYPMAVYRVHKGGVWSAEKNISKYQKWIEVVESCRKHFAPRSAENFSRGETTSYIFLCFFCFDEGKYIDYRKYYYKCLKRIKYIGIRNLLTLTVRYFLSYMPFVAAYYYKARENTRSAG